MTVLPVAGVIALGLGILFVHKIGVARALRIVGNAFIAAGDSVDHWKLRFRQLKQEERQFRGGVA